MFAVIQNHREETQPNVTLQSAIQQSYLFKLLHGQPEISLKLGTIQAELTDYDTLPFVSLFFAVYFVNFVCLFGRDRQMYVVK